MNTKKPETHQSWVYYVDDGSSLARFPADANPEHNPNVYPWVWRPIGDTWELIAPVAYRVTSADGEWHDSTKTHSLADEIFRPGSYWRRIPADAVEAAKREIMDRRTY